MYMVRELSCRAVGLVDRQTIGSSRDLRERELI